MDTTDTLVVHKGKLRFVEQLEGQEYHAFIDERQVLTVRRDPYLWQAFDMRGQALLQSNRYRYDLFDELKNVPTQQLLDPANVGGASPSLDDQATANRLLKQMASPA